MHYAPESAQRRNSETRFAQASELREAERYFPRNHTEIIIEAQLVSQNAVPADDVDGFMYEILVQRVLMEKLAPGADSQTQFLAMAEYLTSLSQELKVELNPRFGTWDPSNLISTPGDETLAVPLPISLG